MINILEYVANMNDDCYCICEYKNNLVVVPCEDSMSGFYPDYNREIIIKENIQLLHKNKNYYDDGMLVEVDRIDGILFNTRNNTTNLVYDTWDGLQITDKFSINSYLEFMDEICNIIK